MKPFFLFILVFSGQLLSAQIFTEASPAAPFDAVVGGATTFSDIDGDGDLDFLLTGWDGNDEISKLYTNDGAGNFTEVSSPFIGIDNSSVAFADIDGDGDEDVLIAGAYAQDAPISKLYTNDGAGNFTEVANDPFAELSDGAIAFADVDGDDDLDVILAGKELNGGYYTQRTLLYLNDGSGNFTEMTGTSFGGATGGVVLFSDIDGDDDLDLFITGIGSPAGTYVSELYTNDGAGNFTKINSSFTNSIYSSAAFADVDGDGDEDLLVGGLDDFAETNTNLYINDGAGIFTEANTPLLGIWSGAVAFADIDNDGDQDILITGQLENFSRITKLYTNNGTGSFIPNSTPFDGVRFSTISFADVNNDNDQDVVITGQNSSGDYTTKLYTNNSTISSAKEITKIHFDFMLYPQPARANKISINYTSEESGSMTVKVFDINGRLLKIQQESSMIGEQTFTVDINSLSKGSYILQLEDGKRTSAQQFLIQ